MTDPREDVEALCCRCGSYETEPEKRWCNLCWDDQIRVPRSLLARLEQAERERDEAVGDLPMELAMHKARVGVLEAALRQIEFASHDPHMAAGHAGFLARRALDSEEGR